MDFKKEGKKLRLQNGITLIALVVTIIVLLILAGVSIAMLTGQNGILVRAQEAKIRSEYAAVLEMLRLEVAEKMMDTEKEDISYIDYLKSKNIITDEFENDTAELNKIASKEIVKIAVNDVESNICYVIDVDILVGNLTTGHGTYKEGDVYYLLEGDLYYKAKEEEKVIDYVGSVYKNDPDLNNDGPNPDPNPDPTPSPELPVDPTGIFTYSTNDQDEIEITGLDLNNICDEEIPKVYSIYDPVEITANMEILTIPSSIDDKTVTKVSFSNFIGLFESDGDATNGPLEIYGIKKIIYPDTVKELRKYLSFS